MASSRSAWSPSTPSGASHRSGGASPGWPVRFVSQIRAGGVLCPPRRELLGSGAGCALVRSSRRSARCRIRRMWVAAVVRKRLSPPVWAVAPIETAASARLETALGTHGRSAGLSPSRAAAHGAGGLALVHSFAARGAAIGVALSWFHRQPGAHQQPAPHGWRSPHPTRHFGQQSPRLD